MKDCGNYICSCWRRRRYRHYGDYGNYSNYSDYAVREERRRAAIRSNINVARGNLESFIDTDVNEYVKGTEFEDKLNGNNVDDRSLYNVTDVLVGDGDSSVTYDLSDIDRAVRNKFMYDTESRIETETAELKAEIEKIDNIIRLLDSFEKDIKSGKEE